MRMCSKCKQEREETDFSFANKAKGIRRTMCRLCVSVLTHKNYTENKDRYVDTNRRKRQRNKMFLAEYLKDKSCTDCGYNDPRALEFDHVKGEKVKDLSRMICDGFSFEKIFAEIEKCEIRCANCHRIATCERAGFYKSKTKQGMV